jgi:hypothetical protein
MAFNELFNFRHPPPPPFGEKTKTVPEKRGATRGRLKKLTEKPFCRLCLFVSISYSLAEMEGGLLFIDE